MFMCCTALRRVRFGFPRARRVFSTGEPGSFYDSQSGQWMTVGNASIRLHEVSIVNPSHLPLLMALVGKSRASSVEIPRLGDNACNANFPDAVQRAMKSPGARGLRSLQKDIHTVVLDVDVGASATAWAQHLDGIADALALGLNVRANLLGALDAEPVQCQLAGAKLADAGCGAIILSGGGGTDEDALDAAIEALLWVDVAGATMLSRLGLRVPYTETGLGIAAAAAARHRVLAFDVDARGRAAPPASALLRALAAAGVDIDGRDPDACAAAEAALAGTPDSGV